MPIVWKKAIFRNINARWPNMKSKKWDERAEENAGIDNPDNYAPQHTPTPWKLHDMETATVVGPDHLAIADCNARSRSTDECIENAAYIVRAVNCHQELLESLREVTAMLEGAYDGKEDEEVTLAVTSALKAIAKAEGK